MQISVYNTHAKSSCTHNHESDVCSVSKRAGLNTSQTTHEANDHGRHARIARRTARIDCEQHFISLDRLTNPVVNVEARHSFLFLFLGTHFQIFVRKTLLSSPGSTTETLKRCGCCATTFGPSPARRPRPERRLGKSRHVIRRPIAPLLTPLEEGLRPSHTLK